MAKSITLIIPNSGKTCKKHSCACKLAQPFQRAVDSTYSCFKCMNSLTQKSTGAFSRKILALTHKGVQEIFSALIFNFSLLQEKFHQCLCTLFVMHM